MSDAGQPENIPIDAFVQFERYIRFVSRDPTKNRSRFYLLSWQPTLDGTVALVCTWGRLGTHGRPRIICSSGQPHIRDIIVRLITQISPKLATRCLDYIEASLQSGKARFRQDGHGLGDDSVTLAPLIIW